MGIVIGVLIYILLIGSAFDTRDFVFGWILIIAPIAFILYALIRQKRNEERKHEEDERRNFEWEVKQKAEKIGPVLNSYREMEKSSRINESVVYVSKIVEEHLNELVFLDGKLDKIVLNLQTQGSTGSKKTVDIYFSDLDLKFNLFEMEAFLYLVLLKCPSLTYRCEVNGFYKETRNLMDAYLDRKSDCLYVKAARTD